MSTSRKRGSTYLFQRPSSEVVRRPDTTEDARETLRPASAATQTPPSLEKVDVTLPPPPRVPQVPTVPLPEVSSPAVAPPTTRRSTLRPRHEDRVKPIAIDAVGTATSGSEQDARRQALADAFHTMCTAEPDDAERAVASFLRLPSVLSLLLANFPGPTWFDWRQPYRKLPRGAQVSPIALALIRLGEPAVPHLAELLIAPRAECRFYAALVARDLKAQPLMFPLARLCLDRNASIRAAATLALQEYAHLPGYEHILERLRQVGENPEARATWRSRAFAASAQLGDPLILGALIESLGSSDRALARDAHHSLRVLTCHDLGTMRLPWTRWQRRHGERPRIGWLIEGLADRRDDLRKRAFRELHRLSGETFGLSEDAPRSAFLQAQPQFRRWWQQRTIAG
ncbi:MAG: hypothetical protein AAGE52_05585 [Myxococcota bacterium]